MKTTRIIHSLIAASSLVAAFGAAPASATTGTGTVSASSGLGLADRGHVDRGSCGSCVESVFSWSMPRRAVLQTPSTRQQVRSDAGSGSELSKGGRTRVRLVDEGIAQFGANGYRHTSLASVARNVGLTPAAAYPYFPTKHDLFLASAEAEIGLLLSDAQRVADDSPTPWITRFMHIVRSVPSYPLIKRILSDEDPEIVRQCLDLPAMRGLFDQLADSLAEAQASGFVRTDIAPNVLALALETVFLGQLLFRVRSGTPELDERASSVGALLAALFVVPNKG